MVVRRTLKETKRQAAERAASGTDAGISFDEAARRKECALAALRELEFKQKSGQLVDVADVERTWCGVVMIVRQKMLALPTKCAPLVARADVAAAHKILTDEVYEILTEISETKVVAVEEAAQHGSKTRRGVSL